MPHRNPYKKYNDAVKSMNRRINSTRSLLSATASFANTIHRASKRRLKEQYKQLAIQEKYRVMNETSREVQQFEMMCHSLISLHQKCGDKWDWDELLTKQQPEKPIKASKHEIMASIKLKTFKPSIFDKLFIRVDKKISSLKEAVISARKDDEKDYQDKITNYEEEYAEWELFKELAIKIKKGDKNGYKEAIENIEPFYQIYEYYTSIEVNVINSKAVIIELGVNPAEVVPSESKSQLKSGKLSVKELSRNKYNELTQEFICSLILRMGREIFALLPVDKLILNVSTELLNTKTGRKNNETIISIQLMKDIMDSLNYEDIIPVDTIELFELNMDFQKTTGFHPVNKLK